MIPWKLYWSAGGATAAASATALLVLFAAPALLGIAVLATCAVVFTLGASRVVHGADIFDRVRTSDRERIVKWLAAAAIVHVALATLWLLRPDLWTLWAGGFAGLVVLEYGIAAAHQYMLTQLKPADVRRAERAHAAELARREQDQDQPRAVLTTALNRAGYDYLTVVDWTTIAPNQRPVGVQYKVRVPSRVASTTKSGKDSTSTPGKLGGTDVEPIAIAMSEVLGHDLESDWVTVTKLPGAGLYTLSVLTEDIMARAIPYRDSREWASITDPCPIGYHITGEPYPMRLDQHGYHVGKSRSGKSSLINITFAHTMRCHDAVLWVCGVEKFYDLIAPWVEPYAGSDQPIPFDWIASGPWDTAAMLAAAMSVARYRQSVPHSQRGAFKKIIIVLDEASFALVMKHVTAEYQGQQCDMSTLVENIVKGAGSAGVHIHIASQRGTNDQSGDKGGSITANIGFQTAFRTRDQAEIGRITGDYKLPIPRNAGEFWVEPGDGGPVTKLKAPYIQETDPNRDHLHDGPTIPDVSWSRRQFPTELDAGSARVAGKEYAARLRYATDELMAYLAGQETTPLPSHGAEFAEARAQMEAELDEIVAGTSWASTHQVAPTGAVPTPRTTDDDTTAGQSPAPVATLVGRKTRKDQILDIITTTENGPLPRAEILETLRATGEDVSEQVVTNTLNTLLKEGRIARPEQGYYLAV